MAHLRRTGRLADGWLSYVVTPGHVPRRPGQDRHRARAAGSLTQFGTGHLLFTRIDDSYEKALDAATETLSVRYAMDFRRAAQRYCALGRPTRSANASANSTLPACAISCSTCSDRMNSAMRQIARFAAEAMPLLRDLTASERHIMNADAT